MRTAHTVQSSRKPDAYERLDAACVDVHPLVEVTSGRAVPRGEEWLGEDHTVDAIFVGAERMKIIARRDVDGRAQRAGAAHRCPRTWWRGDTDINEPTQKMVLCDGLRDGVRGGGGLNDDGATISIFSSRFFWSSRPWLGSGRAGVSGELPRTR